ncbi:LLM class flavin-dependent oxidoreductase [uncultured Amnibacterium sp.]|uniref:LLM class flavin-dependent oxidoreductase n=1 Tax=uncultured Amnibacterium sp. TaxID=1631851 RepID=UPI0035CAF917
MTDRVHDQPLILSSYAIVDERGDQARNYRDAIGLFRRAEQLGVEGVWVRQFHLTDGGRGGLPSPFVLLAALAGATTRLRLGTAAITLPLETPLRVAEDAAVLDAVSGGRVELGLANGGYQPGVPELLGHPAAADPGERRAAYLARIDEVLDALAGRPLAAGGLRLNPAAPGLTDRVWEATLSAPSGFAAGSRGHGVLLGTTQTTPAEVTARAYYVGLEQCAADRSGGSGTVPRVGLATLIYPAASREAALAEAGPGIEEKYAWGRDFLPAATTLAEKAAAINLHHGTSEQITESILAQPALPYATQLMVQTELFYDTYAHRADALEQFTTEIAPALGWTSTRSSDPVPTGARA